MAKTFSRKPLKKEPKIKRFSSKKEEQEFLKKNYAGWEHLMIDENDNVVFKPESLKVLIEQGRDPDDINPIKYL